MSVQERVLQSSELSKQIVTVLMSHHGPLSAKNIRLRLGLPVAESNHVQYALQHLVNQNTIAKAGKYNSIKKYWIEGGTARLVKPKAVAEPVGNGHDVFGDRTLSLPPPPPPAPLLRASGSMIIAKYKVQALLELALAGVEHFTDEQTKIIMELTDLVGR
jgi:hypothetical protein